MRFTRKAVCRCVRRLGQLVTVLLPLTLSAEVVRFEIVERSDFADGQSFGDVGDYERISGKVYYAIDPEKLQNKSIVDLEHAPKNAQGKVEFDSDLYILAPKDFHKGNHAVIYDVNNRGNKLALKFFNDGPGGNNPASPGNGFLFRNGFTIVWSGWNGELLEGNGRLRLNAPVAREKGDTITGPVRYEITTSNEEKTRLPVNRSNHGAYRPTNRGLQTATLTWRLRPEDARVSIPSDQFKLHVTEPEPPLSGSLPLVEVELPVGFRPSYLYELIYETKDPLVHGVCFASVRDLISALKHGQGEQNPCVVDGKPAIHWAYGFGVSQSGRFLREFLYSGFNEDESDRKVFDGLIPHVAGGGLGSFNHRFAQPTAYATQHELHQWPTDRFPFAYEEQRDTMTGIRDGILTRAIKDDVVPRVIHTQSSTEYWSRCGSLVHTANLGTSDSTLPKNVRVFAFGGTQHGPSSFPPKRGTGQTQANPGDYRPYLRALLAALHRWCRSGTPAPPSVYPTIANNTLVHWKHESTGFPLIPGIRYPEVIHQPPLLDFGSRWKGMGIIDVQPPRMLGRYDVMVAKCDKDGNELGCLSPPEVLVPLATFAGWSLRRREVGAENDLVGLSGSYIPFPVTIAQRDASGDPRASLQERYGSLTEYLRRLKAKCKDLHQLGYLLEEDVVRILERQEKRAMPLFEKLSPPVDSD